MTFHSYLAALAALAVVGAAAGRRWGREIRVVWPRPPRAILFLAYALGLLGFIAATDPPFLADENNYWGDIHYEDFAALNYTRVDLADAGVSVRYGEEWRLADARGGHRPKPSEWDGFERRKLDLRGRVGRIFFRNASPEPRPLTLKLIVQNNTASRLALRLKVNGRRLSPANTYPRSRRFRPPLSPDAVVVVSPRFDHVRHERNKSPNLTILSPVLELAPGVTELAIEIAPFSPERAAAPCALSLYDFTNTDAKEFYRLFRRYFFVGDTGDIFETLDFCRNYFNHWTEYSSHYGWRHARASGYCSISDEPPLHHFLGMLALALIGDRISSLSFLYWGELLLLLLTLSWLASDGRPRFSAWATAPLFGVVCAYSVLVRFGVESNAPDTLFALFLMLGLRYALAGSASMYFVFMGLAFYTHLPAPPAAVLFAAAYFIVFRNRRAFALGAGALGVMAALLLLRYLYIALLADPRTALYTGQGLFMTGGTRQMTLRRVLTTGDLAALLLLWPHTKEYTLAVLAVSCFLPFAGLLAKDKTTWTLLAFGLLYHASMCLLDELRAHHIGPPVFAYAAAGVRGLLEIRPRLGRRLALLAACAAAALAVRLCLLWGPDYTGTFSRHPLRLMTHPSEVGGIYLTAPAPPSPGESATPSTDR